MAGVEKKAGPASAGLRLLSVLTALAPAPAFAGAWIAPKGGQVILDYAAGATDETAYDEGSLYAEQPVGHETSLVLTSWVRSDFIDGVRNEATLSAKHVLLRHDDTIVALQAGALWISDPGPGCSEGGAELRVLAGRPVGERSFVNVEAATRALEGGCETQRLDVTAGFRPNAHWMALGQLFLDALQGGDESLKAELSLVHFGHGRLGLRVGVRARLDGDDAEPALVLGYWRSPRG